MRRTLIALSAAIGMAAPAQAYHGFFDYQEPRRPVGGDCQAIAAAIGADATWRGEAYGRRYDSFNETYYPFGARGCFDSEQACRIFLHEAITYAGRGPMSVLSCRRGAD